MKVFVRESKARATLELTRPANVLTSAADILAGYSIALYFLKDGALVLTPLPWLLLAGMCLYAGGVALNDVFDLELDRLERPERALPSGRLSLNEGIFLGIALLLSGVFFASLAGGLSTWMAILVSFLAVSYDAFAKHNPFWGPFIMGCCRGANLLLGASAFGSLAGFFPLAGIPLLFIAAVTMVSRGEVHAKGKRPLWAGVGMYGLIILLLSGLTLRLNDFSPWPFIFLGLFACTVFPPLWNALRDPRPAMVGKAVKWGVLGLIPLDAALGSIFGSWQAGLLILALMPLSIGLARLYAVT